MRYGRCRQEYTQVSLGFSAAGGGGGFPRAGLSPLCPGGLRGDAVAKGSADRTEAALRAMEPVMLESFPLSLEEVFLYEMEEKRYDLTGLF